MSVQSDEKIIEWNRSRIRHVPRLKQEILYDSEPDNTIIYTLRGPRQVGKTTLVKLQIRDFLDQGTCPWNILYYSLDLAAKPQDIVDVINIYLEISKSHRKDGRHYIFLDEASTVKNWQQGIKWLVDAGKLKNCTVVITGSQSINITDAAERMPGRRGRADGSYDKILLPMSFGEYASLDKEMKDILNDCGFDSFATRRSVFEKLLDGDIDHRLERLQAYQNEMGQILKRYMVTGGISRVIDNNLRTGRIDEYVYASYSESIAGQWSALSKDEISLRDLGGTIVKSLSSHISWANLAKLSSLGNQNTAKNYAHVLHDLFVLSIIYRYDDDRKRPDITKDKKLYFHDPFFLHIFNGWNTQELNFESCLRYLEDDANQGHVVEGVTADHLIRLAFASSKKKQMFDYRNHVFYWKDRKGREVDFVLHDLAGTLPIEVKFKNRINPRELAPMMDFLGRTGRERGLVITKNALDAKPNRIEVPASLFLLLA